MVQGTKSVEVLFNVGHKCVYVCARACACVCIHTYTHVDNLCTIMSNALENRDETRNRYS